MEILVKDITAATSFLSNTLPPIAYSVNSEGTKVSLVADIGSKETTSGNITEDKLILYNFLYSKRVLVMYIKNVFIFKRGHISSEYPLGNLENAFRWSATDEGFDFWYDLSVEFREIIQ